MSTQAASAPTIAATGAAIVVVLTDVCDWQDSVRHAARLAAATGRRLRVVVANGGDLLNAANLACVRLMASGGFVSAFDPLEARRLVKAQTARLRRELQELAARLAIEVELIEATTENGLWVGTTALTVFGRRRRGVIMVVHAGTAGTLEVAARLAAERRQEVRLLSAATADPAAIRRLFGPWLIDAPEPLGDDVTLRRPAGAVTVTALVIDPAWLEQRRLTLEALREQWLKLRSAEADERPGMDR
jgi:hypothetical protein